MASSCGLSNPPPLSGGGGCRMTTPLLSVRQPPLLDFFHATSSVRHLVIIGHILVYATS